ncbi:DNA-directed RNA polymerase I subunit RPA34.5-domain-containing protein [Lasiosphaeris hirsuta]|uniref:DNA-directed RNA polymerase I subunit RPA34.5-domain-containing protein n=1 Tax=Lasiosphaeris hirsuta TaxID=260670 RepID=A0AA40E7L4_9PEZI|nr:DNA-directed RNA polymerase I subunit RPA34.5-domain-containing protein [Lasiosphaeris hirsuta]
MDASDVAQIFRDAKSKGKQIWYFTVPAALPIEVIQEQAIPLSTMAAAKAVISHRGSSYTTGAFDDATDTSITVLIPSKTGNKYETLNRPIDRAVHIKRVTRFSQDGDGESAAWTATSTGKSKPPRAQPKGLKARYQPLGVPSNVSMGGNIRMTTSSSGDEDEDVEMAQAPPASSSGTNVTSVTPKVGNKRKHGAVEIGTPGQEVTTSVSTKKVKKARFDTSEAPPSTPKAGKKGVKQTPVAPPLVPGLNGATSSSSALAMRSSNSKTPAGEKRALKKETPVPPPAVPGMNNP